MTEDESPTSVESRESAVFYGGAARRILWSIIVLSVIIVPLTWVRFGRATAEGFFLGAVISYVNFRWLERAVNGLARAIVEFQSPERGGFIVFRFLIRYLLIAIVASVIFISWPRAFKGMLFGLCLPVAAMMGEAVYEGFSAPRHDV